jgi:hypothetical protein
LLQQRIDGHRVRRAGQPVTRDADAHPMTLPLE